MESWAAVALCVVEFDEKHGQEVRAVVPPQALSCSALRDVKMMAMPDCLQAGTKQQFEYQLRIREKDNAECSHHCLNCFVSFKQSRDYNTARGFSQKSVVLICKHPFVRLAFNMLKVLTSVIDALPLQRSNLDASSTDNSDLYDGYVSADSYRANLLSTLEVAMQHMQAWPAPVQDHDISLPFFGEVISFSVPILSTYIDMGVETDLTVLRKNPASSLNFNSATSEVCDVSGSSSGQDGIRHSSSGTIYSNTRSNTYGLGGGAGMFADDNLVDLFKPLGLLPHLWTLWELVVTGKSIVVWSPSVDMCSKVVTALVSLCAPFVYGGDFRPYINPYDSDISLISKALNEKAAIAYPDLTASEEEETHDQKSDTTSFPREFRLQSLHRRSQGLVSSGGAVGQCIGGDRNVNFEKRERLEGNGTNFASTNRPPSIILGITNPFLLKSFNQADAAIFLPLTDPKPMSPFAGERLRKHSLFSSRVSSLEPKTTSAPLPIPLQRNKTTEGRIQQSSDPRKNVHPVSFLDIPPPPPLQHSLSTSESVGTSSVPSFPLRLHGCNVNRIDKTTSLDLAYERWCSVGGVGSSDSRGSTLLTLRAGVCVKPDQNMLQRLQQPAVDTTTNSPGGSFALFTVSK